MDSIGSELDSESPLVSPVVKSCNCCVCFERFPATAPSSSSSRSSGGLLVDEGIFCANEKHFICKADLNQYCSENVFTKIHAIRSKICRIPCPLDDCDASIDLVRVSALLEETQRKRLLNLLNEVVCPVEPRVNRLHSVIQDVLTLTCPGCKVAIDPMPDACSAVMCLNCSCYYCNYCFARFDSRDSARDRADCHTHVGLHQPVGQTDAHTQGDPFLPIEVVQKGQRDFQRERLIVVLRLMLTSRDLVREKEGEREEDAVTNGHLAALALVRASEDIRVLGIGAREVWDTAIQSLLPPEPPSQSVSPSLSIAETERESDREIESEREGVKGARLLAQALLSGNDAAIKQILASFPVLDREGERDSGSAEGEREALDVDFLAETETESGEREGERVSHPLLSLAVLLNNQSLAIELIRRGADPLKRDRTAQGRCPLYVIVERGMIDVLKEVLVCNASSEVDLVNVPLTDEDARYTALHCVARYNMGHLVDFLVKRGADINAVEGEHGYSPLVLAAVMEHHWTCLELVAAGAALDSSPLSPSASLSVPASHCALSTIAEKGLVSVLDAILDRDTCIYSTVNRIVDDSSGWTMLHVAIQFAQHAFVERLLSEGERVDVNRLDNNGLSPLCIALQYFNTHSVMSLLHAPGIDPYNSTLDGHYPIYHLIERGDCNEALEQLLTICPGAANRLVSPSFAAVEDTLSLPLSPAHLALQLGRTHALSLLLTHGTDVNAVESEMGSTLLQYAVIVRNVPAMRLILSHCRRVKESMDVEKARTYKPLRDVTNRQGRTLLYVVAEKGLVEGLTLLRENEDLFEVSDSSLSLSPFSLSRPVCIDALDGSLSLPLHVACMFDQAVMALKLLDLGADPQAKDANGLTPIGLAEHYMAMSAKYAVEMWLRRREERERLLAREAEERAL